MQAGSATGILLFDKSLKFFDFRLALDSYFFCVGEEVKDSGRDELVEDVKFH